MVYPSPDPPADSGLSAAVVSGEAGETFRVINGGGTQPSEGQNSKRSWKLFASWKSVGTGIPTTFHEAKILHANSGLGDTDEADGVSAALGGPAQRGAKGSARAARQRGAKGERGGGGGGGGGGSARAARQRGAKGSARAARQSGALACFQVGAKPPGRAGRQAWSGRPPWPVLEAHGQGARSRSEADDHGHLQDARRGPERHHALDPGSLIVAEGPREDADLRPDAIGSQRDEFLGEREPAKISTMTWASCRGHASAALAPAGEASRAAPGDVPRTFAASRPG